MKVYLQNWVHFLALTVHIENILPQVMFIDKFNRHNSINKFKYFSEFEKC